LLCPFLKFLKFKVFNNNNNDDNDDNDDDDDDDDEDDDDNNNNNLITVSKMLSGWEKSPIYMIIIKERDNCIVHCLKSY